jgi:hypothetical protein
MDRANDRYADDVHINREMREVERWNDPAAEFLTVSTLSHIGRQFELTCPEEKEKGTKTT